MTEEKVSEVKNSKALRFRDKVILNSLRVHVFGNGFAFQELLNTFSPLYDLDLFDVESPIVNDPSDANVLIISGPVAHKSVLKLQKIQSSLRSPSWTIWLKDHEESFYASSELKDLNIDIVLEQEVISASDIINVFSRIKETIGQK